MASMGDTADPSAYPKPARHAVTHAASRKFSHSSGGAPPSSNPVIASSVDVSKDVRPGNADGLHDYLQDEFNKAEVDASGRITGGTRDIYYGMHIGEARGHARNLFYGNNSVGRGNGQGLSSGALATGQVGGRGPDMHPSSPFDGDLKFKSAAERKAEMDSMPTGQAAINAAMGSQYANATPDERRSMLQEISPVGSAADGVADRRDLGGGVTGTQLTGGGYLVDNNTGAAARLNQAATVKTESEIGGKPEAPGYYNANGHMVAKNDPSAARVVGDTSSPAVAPTATQVAQKTPSGVTPADSISKSGALAPWKMSLNQPSFSDGSAGATDALSAKIAGGPSQPASSPAVAPTPGATTPDLDLKDPQFKSISPSFMDTGNSPGLRPGVNPNLEANPALTPKGPLTVSASEIPAGKAFQTPVTSTPTPEETARRASVSPIASGGSAIAGIQPVTSSAPPYSPGQAAIDALGKQSANLHPNSAVTSQPSDEEDQRKKGVSASNLTLQPWS